VRFRHIVDAIDEIAKFTKGMTFDQYCNDTMVSYAVERALLIVAEAATALGADAEALCPHIPWREIRGLGNQLRHAYDGVDPSVLWEIIQDDLPKLRATCLPHASGPSASGMGTP